MSPRAEQQCQAAMVRICDGVIGVSVDELMAVQLDGVVQQLQNGLNELVARFSPFCARTYRSVPGLQLGLGKCAFNSRSLVQLTNRWLSTSWLFLSCSSRSS